MTFAKHLADQTGRAVLLIPGARGDTSFTPKNGWTWDPADTRTRRNLYRNGIAAIDAALARYPGSTVATILWHQGETDVPLMTGPVYETKLDSVIDDLRGRYGRVCRSAGPDGQGGNGTERQELRADRRRARRYPESSTAGGVHRRCPVFDQRRDGSALQCRRSAGDGTGDVAGVSHDRGG